MSAGDSHAQVSSPVATVAVRPPAEVVGPAGSTEPRTEKRPASTHRPSGSRIHTT